MKKTLYILGISAALMAVSCTIEENKFEQPVQKGYHIEFTGYTSPDSKVSIGEKDGEVYPLLWTVGDVISIYSKDLVVTEGGEGEEPVVNGNINGEFAELFTESAGKTSGVFQTGNTFSLDEDEDIVILYPASSLTYNDGKIRRTISNAQTQLAANSSLHVGQNVLSYAETTLKAGQTEGVKFNLAQKTAFVKLSLSTTEFADLNLVGAKLYSPESELSGEVEYDVNTNQLTVVDGEENAGVVLRTPVPFNEKQDLYFTAIPCDLTGKEVYVIVTMGNDSKNVTLPIKIEGGLLKESCLSVINVTNISTSDNEFEWYDPVETRYLVDGWAYGPQNTYYIESKASGEGETSLKIDVKARGDFSKVAKPKYYGLLTSSSEMSTRKFIHLPNDVATYEEQPINTVNADWTIDVYAYDQSQNGNWAVVGIYDENYRILWSYMICKYKSGDEVKDVAYPGTDVVLMDRVLGISRSNAVAEAEKNFDVSAAYFQWGRKDPFQWSNSKMEQYNMKFPTVGSDISESIEHPTIVYAFNSETGGDWQYKEHRTDLWGGVNNTSDWYDPSGVGHKTIYDPCPKGYRVPDARVFVEVSKNAEIWECDLGREDQPEANINPDSPFIGKTTAVLAYPLGGGKYDYWPYVGARFGDKENWGNRTSSNNRHGCIYWANSVDPVGLSQGVMMEYCYFSTAYNQNTRHYANRGQSFPIRCQKDTENR